MKRAAVTIGFTCNNNCVFCLDKEKRYLKTPSIEEIKRAIIFLSENGFEDLYIINGEPLISKYFFEIAEFAKEKGIKRIEVQTNARILYYKEIINRLKKIEPLKISVSFHFPNTRLYKKYCLADGFDQVVSGIKNLIKYKFDFGINMLIMKPNIHYLEKMVIFLRSIGFKEKIILNFVIGKNITKEDYRKIVPKFSECSKIIEKIINKDPKRIVVNGIPPCVFIKKIRKNVTSCSNNEEKVFIIDARSVPSKGLFFPSKKNKKKMFIQLKACKKCKLKSECMGIRKEYYYHYGSKEIKAIT